MKSYRKYNWPALLEEFERSGLTQAQFCLDKNINPKYFSQKRKAATASTQTSFTQVTVETPKGMTLEVGRCKIHCTDTLSLAAIVELVHRLA